MKKSWMSLVVAVALVVLQSVGHLEAQGNHAQIEDWYERGQYQNVVDAVVPDPAAYPHSIFVAGRALEKLNRVAEARQQYERLLPIGGAWYYIGTSNTKRFDGDWAGAAADAGTAAQMEFFDIPEHNYGYHLAGIGDYFGAGTHLDYGLQLNPGYEWGYWFSFIAWNEVYEATDETFYRYRALYRLSCFVEHLEAKGEPRPAEYEVALIILNPYGGSLGCSMS